MRPDFSALLQSQQTLIMGVVNVTPDSFSDGGRYASADHAVAHAMALDQQGAHILDIGGESTRPGAKAVSAQEEMDRVLPVIETLCTRGKIVSVDTRNASTMREAIRMGAKIINDVSALSGDSHSISELKNHHDVHVCLMHMQGDPQVMQKNPKYNNVVSDVYDYLSERIKICETAGIEKDRLIVDPGIGFGKTLGHNIDLMRSISRFSGLGVPVLLGASRKSFIEHICPGAAPDQRIGGSLAAALWAAGQGVRILRVHDVHETAQALSVFQAIRGAGS